MNSGLECCILFIRISTWLGGGGGGDGVVFFFFILTKHRVLLRPIADVLDSENIIGYLGTSFVYVYCLITSSFSNDIQSDV